MNLYFFIFIRTQNILAYVKFLSFIERRKKQKIQFINHIQQLQYRFKSLTNQQKLDVISIRDKEFIHRFLKFSGEQYQNRLINFVKGYSIPNILSVNENKTHFNQIKNFLCIALTSQPLLYLNCQSNKLIQEIIEWLDQVTAGKGFQYANKIVNKQEPEDNILWFNSQSMHSLQEWLANQLEKSIIKHFYRKDLLPSYKLKQFTEFMIQKHLNESKYLKLSIDQARKLTRQQIQNYCNIIKTYQNQYYQNIRQNFIIDLENDKKKKKNKRKPKKKTSSVPHNVQTEIVISPHKKTVNLSEKQSDQQENQLLIPENQLLIVENQKLIKQNNSQQNTQKIQQSTQDYLLEQSTKKSNKSQQGKPKKCICKEETSSNIIKCDNFKQKKSKNRNNNRNNNNRNSNSKNLVVNKQRSQSPYSKSNTLDNDCSKSLFSGQVYDTFTEAITEQCSTKAQQFQLENYTQQLNQNDQNNQTNCQKKQRKRRKNNSSNKQIQQLAKSGTNNLINKQLTNFIDSLSIQTNNLYESKVISFQRVRYFIKTLFPQTQAMLFGSNSMGLSLPSSDVDIMLYNVPCKSKDQIKDMLAKIAIQINAMGWIVSCSTYLNAKAPLVKLQIDPLISYFETKRRCDYPNVYDPMILYYLDIKDKKKAKNIFVDLTINLEDKDAGYSPSTQLMRSWVNSDPTLQRIILVFKYILAQKGYNKNFSGGLGSYCLFIMIAAYFKQFRSQLPQDEGQIFLNILKFYSEQFENKLKSITLRQNQSCFISLQESLNIANFSQAILSNPLRIIDPLSQKLMSSSCGQYQLIKNEFRRIRVQIEQQIQTIQRQIITNYSPIQQNNKLDITLKSIQKWIHKYQVRNRFSIKKIIDGNGENR